MSLHSLKILFSDEAGPPIFIATSSRDRMKFLLSTMTFHNSEEHKEIWPYDRLAAVLIIFKMLNSNISKYLLPSLYLSTEKTLYPMRHQIAFWQCNPSKSHRYGSLIEVAE